MADICTRCGKNLHEGETRVILPDGDVNLNRWAHKPCLEGYQGAIDVKHLPDERVAVLYKQVFGARILIGDKDDKSGGNESIDYDERYTFHEILVFFAVWDGYGQPEGYYRHKIGGQPWRRRCKRCDGTGYDPAFSKVPQFCLNEKCKKGWIIRPND